MSPTGYFFEEGYDEGYRDGASRAKQDLSQWVDLLNELLEWMDPGVRAAAVDKIRLHRPQYLIVYDPRRPKPLSIERLT